jgi:hypothetical protein
MSELSRSCATLLDGHANCSPAFDKPSSPGSALLTHERMNTDTAASRAAQAPGPTLFPTARSCRNRWAATPRISPEMTLLLACLRWPAANAAEEQVRACARDDLDWAKFVALTNRHRVSTLVETRLALAAVSPPPPYAGHLRRLSRETVLGEFGLAHELKGLQARLAARSVRPVVLKGAVVSMRAYGRLGLRFNRDIDLLVSDQDVAVTDEILIGCGYRRFEPSGAMAEAELRRWRRQRKDFAYQHPETNRIVELHWRLFDNPALMPTELLPEPEEIAILPGFSVLALPAETDLIYLCVHGAEHAWSRLKWLADVGRIFARLRPDELMAVFDLAARLGVQRPVAQALLLCRRLLGLSPPERLLRLAQTQWRTRWLEQVALHSMLSGGATEMEERFLGSTLKNLGHYSLADGLSFYANEAAFDLTASASKTGDRDPGLHALVTRPVSWSVGQMRKLLRLR